MYVDRLEMPIQSVAREALGGPDSVDIDGIISEFNALQQYAYDVTQEKVVLVEKMEIRDRQMTAKEEQGHSLKSEMDDLKATINKLQAILTRHCDVNEENRKLKEKLKEMEEAKNKMEQEQREALFDLQSTIEELKVTHDMETITLQDTLKEAAESTRRRLEQQLCERHEESEKLRCAMKELEQQHQAELVRVRLEYDGKLMKMQKQAGKLQQNAVCSSASGNTSQDIFRKKLQHAKLESDREIASLKNTMAELRRQLGDAQPTRGRGRPAIAPPSKRPRNY